MLLSWHRDGLLSLGAYVRPIASKLWIAVDASGESIQPDLIPDNLLSFLAGRVGMAVDSVG